MKEIIASLLIYIGQQSINTDKNDLGTIQVTSKTPPTIELKSKRELVHISLEGKIPEGYNYRKNRILALYDHKNNKIYIKKSIDLESSYGKSVILHELVHFNQYANGEYDNVECKASNEPLAYRIQNQYLRDNDEYPYFGKKFVYFASRCAKYL